MPVANSSIAGLPIGFLRFDFPGKKIQLAEVNPLESRTEILCEIPMNEESDVSGIHLVKEPWNLIWEDRGKMEIHWPNPRTYMLLPHETVCIFRNDTFLTTCWEEDRDYRERIIYRRLLEGSIIQEQNGYLAKIADGRFWKMLE